MGKPDKTDKIKKERESTARNKAKFLIEFENSKAMVYASCKNAGIHPDTYYEWRKKDVLFKKDCEIIEARSCEHVESEMMKQIEKGNTTLTIFYLVNRSKGKYQNIQRVEMRPDDNTTAKIDRLMSDMAKLLE